MLELERALSSVHHGNKDLRVDSQECFVLAACHALAFARHRALTDGDANTDHDIVVEDVDDFRFCDTLAAKLGMCRVPTPWWRHGRCVEYVTEVAVTCSKQQTYLLLLNIHADWCSYAC